MPQEETLTNDSDPSAAETRHAIVFSGNGREYFGIWIVNLALSLVTLGIYSAWAKVRRMQYFYRNTTIAGGSFDYHGDPKAILKGRLIALVLLLLYHFSGNLHPVAGLIVFAALTVVMPRLLLRSLQFRMHNSSYRGLRFEFFGTLKQSYTVFLGLPLASLLTAYLLVPFTHQRLRRFLHDGSRFGETPFAFSGSVGAFYRLYFKTFGLALAGMLATGFLATATFGALAPSVQRLGVSGTVVMGFCFFGALFLLVLLIGPYFEARLQNLVWSHTTLGPHRFESRISARRLFAIRFTNLLAVVATLGLFRPFAVVRLTKYRSESIALIAAGDLDHFVANNAPPVAAIGEEAAEMFDIDIAL